MLTLRNIEASLSLSKPIELFKFTHGVREYLYTSGPRDFLAIDGTIYKSIAIQREKIQRTSEDYKNALDIDVPHDNPVAMLFRKTLPSHHVYIEITQVQRDDKTKFRHIFSGEVSQVVWNNHIASLSCNPASALMRRQVLRMGYHAQCNHHVYDDLCTLNLADWQENAIVNKINEQGFKVEVLSRQHDDDYYLAGLLSTESGDHRTIVGVHGDDIEIMSPIDGLKVGDRIKLAKGCNRSAAACQSFDNFDNFFGCLTIPEENPFL